MEFREGTAEDLALELTSEGRSGVGQEKGLGGNGGKHSVQRDEHMPRLRKKGTGCDVCKELKASVAESKRVKRNRVIDPTGEADRLPRSHITSPPSHRFWCLS